MPKWSDELPEEMHMGILKHELLLFKYVRDSYRINQYFKELFGS